MQEEYTTVTLPYGQEKLSIKIPRDRLAWTCSPADIPGVADPEQAVREALDNPIGSPNLSTLVRSRGKRTVLLLDDDTRSTPQSTILPVLLNCLNEAGVADEDITGIIAVGTHRHMTEEECLAKYGEEAMSRIRIINHIYDDPTELVDLGTTELGVPISVNRQFYEAELSIAVGNIIPHMYAGWAGGAKMVQPGVSGPKTTSATHLVAAPRFPEILGRVENPVRHEMEEVARQTKLDFIVNTVLNRNHEIACVVAGDVVAAHRAGVKVAERVYSFRPTEQPDLIVVSSHPADKDFWQALKAYTAASMLIKPGGTVLFLSPCWEGVAPDHPIFYELGQVPHEGPLADALAGKYDDGVAVATYCALDIARKRYGRTIVYTEGITRDELHHLGFEATDDPQATLDSLIKEIGPQTRIGIITHGADVNPVIESL
jgi:nickel-dependent lactate racemase